MASTDGSTGATHLPERARTAGIRALVVEDEAPMAAVIGSYLEREGFEVHVTHDGLSAVEQAREVDPDIVVLDLGLPGQDGVEVCRQLRRLSVGADDYMTKPFSPRERVARLRAMLRRPRPLGSPTPDREGVRVFGPLAIDPVGRDVWLDEQPVSLTRTEFDVLAALSERPRMAFSRRQLIDAVWGQTWVGDEHLVDVHIGHLRRKLGDDAAVSRFIRTVRGVGYRMGTGQ